MRRIESKYFPQLSRIVSEWRKSDKIGYERLDHVTPVGVWLQYESAELRSDRIIRAAEQKVVMGVRNDSPMTRPEARALGLTAGWPFGPGWPRNRPAALFRRDRYGARISGDRLWLTR
jgi:hypothetical protein